MSGTSADGVDVAVCRIGPGRGEGDSPRVKLIGHLETAYPKALQVEVLRVMEGAAVTAAEMSRLNWRLGAIYADCVERAAAKFGVRIGLVGCHGQTVHHEVGMGGAGAARKADSFATLRNDKQKAAGARGLRSTWQMGEAAVIAERMRCPVVSDFRPADLAAGGQGAPLVPMLDWCMFRSAKVSRVLLNLGGIGNVTALPAGCRMDGVTAFDTGPGNMVIDGCMATLFGKKYDRGGVVGRRGRVLSEVVERLMREGYFSALPPKSCGREEFGVGFAERLIAMCRKEGAGDADCVATATALTAASVVDAYRRFVWAHVGMAAPLAKVEFCVAGGGAKNITLMGMLREGFAELGVKVRAMEELGVPAQAKEGVAFALLAWLTWNGLAGNVPAATGAARGVVLGKVSYG
jgi:anhydro-N-acetylmuramic acid kinase